MIVSFPSHIHLLFAENNIYCLIWVCLAAIVNFGDILYDFSPKIFVTGLCTHHKDTIFLNIHVQQSSEATCVEFCQSVYEGHPKSKGTEK